MSNIHNKEPHLYIKTGCRGFFHSLWCKKWAHKDNEMLRGRVCGQRANEMHRGCGMQQVMYLEERCFRPTLVINTPGFANGHYDTLHVWGHHCLPKEGRILLHRPHLQNSHWAVRMPITPQLSHQRTNLSQPIKVNKLAWYRKANSISCPQHLRMIKHTKQEHHAG